MFRCTAAVVMMATAVVKVVVMKVKAVVDVVIWMAMMVVEIVASIPERSIKNYLT